MFFNIECAFLDPFRVKLISILNSYCGFKNIPSIIRPVGNQLHYCWSNALGYINESKEPEKDVANQFTNHWSRYLQL